MQFAARAYGDWQIVRDAMKRVSEFDGDSQVKETMETLILLHILETFDRNAKEYVKANIMGPAALKVLAINRIVRKCFHLTEIKNGFNREFKILNFFPKLVILINL